jgi:hypothetical protein
MILSAEGVDERVLSSLPGLVPEFALIDHFGLSFKINFPEPDRKSVV